MNVFKKIHDNVQGTPLSLLSSPPSDRLQGNSTVEEQTTQIKSRLSRISICTQQVEHKLSSELLLERCPWNIIHTIWLRTKWCVPNKWHCTTAICCLSSHGVHTNNHCDDTSVEKEESKDTDSNNAIEQEWVLWLPFDVTILIDLSRHTSGAGSDQNHDKLNQKGPCGHVHAILAPTLRRAPAVGKHQRTHAGTHKEDGQHWAEHNHALAILHSLGQQRPFEASELLHSDCGPDPNVHKEELECEIDDTLHGRRDWDSVLRSLRVCDCED